MMLQRVFFFSPLCFCASRFFLALLAFRLESLALRCWCRSKAAGTLVTPGR